MKAIARKIKDNEWIAEVTEHRGGDMFEQGQWTETYPIVSPSDKEWLEKNNMDGKEVEGKVWNYDLDTLYGEPASFQLTTPPVHSDPAGEENKILKDALHALCMSTVPLSLKPGTEVYDRVKIGTALLNRLGYYDESQPPTPQTGRTYTEGEVVELLEWMRESGYHPVVTNNGTLTGWLKGGMSVIHPSKAIPHEYLKQNPKP